MRCARGMGFGWDAGGGGGGVRLDGESWEVEEEVLEAGGLQAELWCGCAVRCRVEGWRDED